jgi:hypothetical protein
MTTISPPRSRAPIAEAPVLPLALARPRCLSRRGRAALLWFLTFYALAQLALNLVLADWHPTLQDNCQSYKLQKIRELAAGAPDRPLLVMLGSSRTQCALQAGLLNGLPGTDGQPLLAYNLGVQWAGPIHACLYLHELLDAGIRPRLLLVECSPLLLAEPQRGLNSEEDWTLGPWLSLSRLARCWPYFSRPSAKAMEWLQARLAPWYVFRFHLLTWWQERAGRTVGIHAEREHDPWGWFHHPVALNRELRALCVAINRETLRPTLSNFRVGTGPLRAMRDLLETARRQRIPVVLVHVPESSEFRSWYRSQGLADVLRCFADLRDTYAVDAIDASRWLADEDFRDGHHAEESGARTFTARLIEELQPILARLRDTPSPPEPAAVAAAGSP